ncbi:hypothetical protein CEP54_002453 [Fusarium duplospermum]|uniref:Uncharacterized protein n=1 Tax=Fusarium duplospermum TaxID=1325734 RepID=A0A428QV56_9HYPO|nr:hypothetical protein CEP54_002453 [Fusarium duplospermum]
MKGKLPRTIEGKTSHRGSDGTHSKHVSNGQPGTFQLATARLNFPSAACLNRNTQPTNHKSQTINNPASKV